MLYVNVYSDANQINVEVDSIYTDINYKYPGRGRFKSCSCPIKYLLCYRNTEIFPIHHAAPFSKMLTFFRKEPFDLEARYTDASSINFPEARIGRYLHMSMEIDIQMHTDF